MDVSQFLVNFWADLSSRESMVLCRCSLFGSILQSSEVSGAFCFPAGWMSIFVRTFSSGFCLPILL